MSQLRISILLTFFTLVTVLQRKQKKILNYYSNSKELIYVKLSTFEIN